MDSKACYNHTRYIYSGFPLSGVKVAQTVINSQLALFIHLYRGKYCMINIAVVEDDKTSADLICDYIQKYKSLHGEGTDFNVRVFGDAVGFLEDYKPSRFDLVLMDIMMPYMDGMRAAEKLREIDSVVLIIFITNMGDYAVRGYDVKAMAFIKKPVSYADFELKFSRAVSVIRTTDVCALIIPSGLSEVKIMVRDLMYVEVRGHICSFHMSDGRIIESHNTLSAVAKKLENYGFAMCSSSYLVNMNYIKLIDGGTVLVGDNELMISRLKRKDFMQSFNEWASRSGMN